VCLVGHAMPNFCTDIPNFVIISISATPCG